MRRNTESSFYQYGTHAPIGSVSHGKAMTSRSEPDLVHQRISTKGSSSPQKLSFQKSTHRERERPRSFHPPQHMHNVNGTVKSKSNKQVVRTVTTTKTLPKPAVPVQVQETKKKEFVCNGNSGATEITMKEAVEYLSKPDENFQHCGASYIQHNAYMDDNAKEEVLKYNGIPPMISLLRSPNSTLSQTASAALRNLSFKNIKAKEEIQHCGGITAAVALLQETDSTEMQKQLTGKCSL
uniref:Uncharacterized protein n=1 Tax=Knipowitschia caucasica TaxID=637954 RepID=A0AAV2M744_KNICA